MAQSSAVAAIGPMSEKRAMRPIDLVHLAKQCLGDEHLEYEILRLFDTTMGVYFTRLMTAQTPEDLRLSLHSIKGASLGVGAFTIAEIAKAAEARLQADGVVSAEAVADLGVAVEEVRAFITEMLSKEPA